MLRETKILRWSDLQPIVGCSRQTIWRMERDGNFPKRIKIGSSSVGWLEHEVEAWLAERMANRVDDEKFLVSRDIDGDVVHTPHKQTLCEMVGDLDLDVVIVDPFVQSHAVSESSNEAISQVMVGLRETLTAGRGAALHLVHHNRKPMAGNSHQAGDLYAARGASSMQGEAHFVFTLADMDNDSQRAFGIDDDAKGRYVRLDDAKSKMAPPTGAKWFQRHGAAMLS